MLEEEELKNAVLCILANKQDVEGALSEEKITEELGLSKIKNRQWGIFKTSAKEGYGINEGFDWVYNALTSQK